MAAASQHQISCIIQCEGQGVLYSDACHCTLAFLLKRQTPPIVFRVPRIGQAQHFGTARVAVRNCGVGNLVTLHMHHRNAASWNCLKHKAAVAGMRGGKTEQNLWLAVFGNLRLEHDAAACDLGIRVIYKDRLIAFLMAQPAQGETSLRMISQCKPSHYATFAARKSSASYRFRVRRAAGGYPSPVSGSNSGKML